MSEVSWTNGKLICVLWPLFIYVPHKSQVQNLGTQTQAITLLGEAHLREMKFFWACSLVADVYLAGDVREHILFQNLWLRLFRGGTTFSDYLWLCETL